MHIGRIFYLFQRYIERSISEVELYELSSLLLEGKDNTEIKEALEQIMLTMPREEDYAASDWDHIYRKIVSGKVEEGGQVFILDPGQRMEGLLEEAPAEELRPIERPGLRMEGRTRFMRYSWIGWAAAVLIIAVATGTWYFGRKELVPAAQISQFGGDVEAPRQHKATLTLSNGSRILLERAGVGTLIKEGGVSISKLEEGQIAYSGPPGIAVGEALQKNTLLVPVGSRPVNIYLSDGTKVWLDAGSSLTYPVAFSGKDRSVEMTGQGYFEVARNPTKRFVVLAGGISTEVLGTHFNICIHPGEGDKRVSLVEGSVKVSLASGKALKLEPGQNARLTTDGELKIGVEPDIDQVMAWKNGLFSFERTNIQIIMRQVARRYDASIVYQGDVRQLEFSGTVASEKNMSEILKMLEMTGAIHFRIEGRNVYVTK